MPDQVKVNDVGDVVLEDAAQLRALADQDRLAVFTRLQRHGPAAVTELATGLDRDRDAAAGLFNAGVALTSDELNRVQEELEELLLPYLNRSEADRPKEARQVRMLAYFLPSDGA